MPQHRNAVAENAFLRRELRQRYGFNRLIGSTPQMQEVFRLIERVASTDATILILGPILAPLAIKYGIDPVHFGLVMIVNIAIGMVTPPVAVNLNVASEISGVSMDAMTRPVLVFLAVLTVDVLVISYVPALSLALL